MPNWNTIGFQKQKELFSLRGDTLPVGTHLFYGQEGVGKMTFALDLAEQLTGQDYNKDQAELNQNLLVIDSGGSKSGQTVSIDDVRKINRFLSFAPIGSKVKVVIINEAHSMQEPAQNALLKIIEEPPSFALIILVSYKHDSILPTILSRCRKVYFPPHDEKTLKKIISKSGAVLNDEQIDFLISFSNGKSGLILNIINNQSFKEIKKIVKEFYDMDNMTMGQRIIFAAKLSGDEDGTIARTAVLYWTLYLRSKLLQYNSDKVRIIPVLKNLLNLYYILSIPHFNHKLAIENFVINL